jgi:hypothetical protein
LPLFPTMTEAQLDMVVAAVRDFWSQEMKLSPNQ